MSPELRPPGCTGGRPRREGDRLDPLPLRLDLCDRVEGRGRLSRLRRNGSRFAHAAGQREPFPNHFKLPRPLTPETRPLADLAAAVSEAASRTDVPSQRRLGRAAEASTWRCSKGRQRTTRRRSGSSCSKLSGRSGVKRDWRGLASLPRRSESARRSVELLGNERRAAGRPSRRPTCCCGHPRRSKRQRRAIEARTSRRSARSSPSTPAIRHERTERFVMRRFGI